MPSGPRALSYNVIGCLEAISAAVIDVMPTVVAASERAETVHMDPITLGQLVRIERTLNTIRRHAQNARSNRYEEAA
jgi:hypothetical protein